jgi:hypothetical protein
MGGGRVARHAVRMIVPLGFVRASRQSLVSAEKTAAAATLRPRLDGRS